MPDLRAVSVGDELLRFEASARHLPGRPVRVTKVGRTLITLEYGEQFRIDTGFKNDNSGRVFVLTPEMHTDRERKSAAVAKMRDLGIYFTTSADQYSVEKLEAVVKILETEEN